MNAAAGLPMLSPAELQAVATLWRDGGRELQTRFSGTSMLPAIRPGDLVTVACGAEARVGEVAVFRFADRIGVHRVAHVAPDWLLTWGDANRLPDAPIPRSQLVGTIPAAPPARASLARRALLRAVAPPGAGFATVARRVGLAHGAQRAWANGPIAFLQACLRHLLRRTPPLRSTPP